MAQLIIKKEGILESKKIMEGKEEKYYLKGKCAEFGIVNKNGRVYEKNNYLQALQPLLERIKTRSAVGSIDHPADLEPKLSTASHLVVEVGELDENSMYTTLEVLNHHPEGKKLKALILDNVGLFVSSRSYGQVYEDGRVELMEIVTYDVVSDPGFKDAKIELVKESYNHKYGEIKLNRIKCLEDECTIVYEIPENLLYNKYFRTAIKDFLKSVNELRKMWSK